MDQHVGGGGGGGAVLFVATVVVTSSTGTPGGRLLQADSEWFSWLLASVLGIVGIAACVVLVYVISLACDKGSRWCFRSYYNEIATAAAAAARLSLSHSNEHRGLDRSRLDIADRKQIVKELFAKETFLYGVDPTTTAVSSLLEKNHQQQTGSTEDDIGTEAGIELQNMTTQETSESDDTPIKVRKEEGKATDNVDSERSRDMEDKDRDVVKKEEEDNDKDLEKGIVKKKEGEENKLGNEEVSGNECCICLAPYIEGDVVLRSKHCPHMFHATCCEDWIMQKPVCPLCTAPMILDAEWEATAVSVLGQERYDALLAEQIEGREAPAIVSSA